MSLGRVLLAAAVSVAALTVAREASAFCRTTTCNDATESCEKNERGCVRDGVTVVWKELPIIYRFSAEGSEKLSNRKVRAAVTAAFSTWESVKCPNGRTTSVRFELGPDIKVNKPLGRKQAKDNNGIYFRDETWPYKNAVDSLALTNQIYGEERGIIEYADIEINTAETSFSLSDDDTDAIDFQSVMIHEVGHYLGLAHSNDPESIMVPSYCEASNRCDKGVIGKRELSDDDIEGVCGIYPPGKGDPDENTVAPSPTGCTQSPSRGSDLAAGLALVFVASAVVRRRLRTSRPQ